MCETRLHLSRPWLTPKSQWHTLQRTEHEMAKNTQKYERRSAFDTVYGPIYETKMAALLYLRLLDSKMGFQLATNVEGLGAWGDIVFRFKDKQGSWSTSFMQLKHRQGKKASVTKAAVASAEGDASLQALCQQYVEELLPSMDNDSKEDDDLLSGDVKDHNLVFFTNAPLSLDGNDPKCSSVSEGIAEPLLKFSFWEKATGKSEKSSNNGTTMHPKVFKFKPPSLLADRSIPATASVPPTPCPTCKQVLKVQRDPTADIDSAVKFCVDNYTHGRDFVERFRMFSGQPNESELDEFIKDEIKKVEDAKVYDVEVICKYFLSEVKVWCETEGAIDFLHEKSEIFQKALHKVMVETLSEREKGNLCVPFSFGYDNTIFDGKLDEKSGENLDGKKDKKSGEKSRDQGDEKPVENVVGKLDEKSEAFMTMLLDKMPRSPSDTEGDVIGIPLQMRMLGEIFRDQVNSDMTHLPDKIDELYLLEKFVEKKLNVFVRNKLHIDEKDQLVAVEDSLTSHMAAALVLLLSTDELGGLVGSETVMESWEKFKKLRNNETGIIDSIVRDKPRFVHSVFADYLMARWFVKHFEKNKPFIENNFFLRKNAVVLNFFDRIRALVCKDGDKPA